MVGDMVRNAPTRVCTLAWVRVAAFPRYLTRQVLGLTFSYGLPIRESRGPSVYFEVNR